MRLVLNDEIVMRVKKPAEEKAELENNQVMLARKKSSPRRTEKQGDLCRIEKLEKQVAMLCHSVSALMGSMTL